MIIVCALVIICGAISVNGQAEPQIVNQILPEIKKTGMTGYLNCTVTRQYNNKVYWIHKDRQNIITSDDSVDIDERFNELVDGFPKYDVEKRIHGDSTTYTLIIRRLNLQDAGTYTCQINIKGSQNHPSKDGKMVVLIPPTISQGRTTQTVNVQEGDNVTLSCDASGYPTPNITWVRANGHALPPPINRFSIKTKKLTLMSLGRRDRGVYRCLADNNVRPPATYDATLYVDFKPHSRPVQTTYGQAPNRLFDLTIECVVAGYPAPNMKWYKKVGEGADPITNDEKHVIHQLLNHGQTLSISEVWYQLTIINVQANDYGYYYCEGTNRLGSNRAMIQVYETSECQGPNCPPEGGFVPGNGCSETAISLTTLYMTAILFFLFH